MHWTNGALLAVAVLMSLTVGLKAYLVTQLPLMAITGTAGLLLFYVQHQFKEYEERGELTCNRCLCELGRQRAGALPSSR